MQERSPASQHDGGCKSGTVYADGTPAGTRSQRNILNFEVLLHTQSTVNDNKNIKYVRIFILSSIWNNVKRTGTHQPELMKLKKATLPY